MVSAYVLVSVEAGKNQEVIAALRSMDAVKRPTPVGANPTSSRSSKSPMSRP